MSRKRSAVQAVILGVTLLNYLCCNYVEGLGVNWGSISSHKLPPSTVVQLMKDNGIHKVKLFDADESSLKALAGSGIEVMVGCTNLELVDMADPAKAKDWVQKNVLQYLSDKGDGVNITYVAVGNEPFLKDYKDRFVNSTLPALKGVQKALNDAGVGDHIRATVPLNGDVYYSPWYNPNPSGGLFRPDIAEAVTDIVKFLDENKAPFIVNIYPFLSLYMSHGAFPFEYAFFDGGNSIQDGKIKYDNVFDANYDTCVSALRAAGFPNTTVVVGEIGWPTDGNAWANVSLASRFYNGLLPRLGANKGTPLVPGYIEVYLFGLLDEDAKSTLPGDFERSWGIFRYDGQPKFEMDFAGKEKNHTLVGAKNVKYQPRKWCVMKSNDSSSSGNQTEIDGSVKYACDRADCTPLADGGSCGGLSDNDKKSYAFNSYFQVANQSEGSCDFEGMATVVDKDPSQGTCNFTIQIVANATDDHDAAALPPSHEGSDDHDHGSGDKEDHGSGHSRAAPPPRALHSAPLAAAAVLAIISFIFDLVGL